VDCNPLKVDPTEDMAEFIPLKTLLAIGDTIPFPAANTEIIAATFGVKVGARSDVSKCVLFNRGGIPANALNCNGGTCIEVKLTMGGMSNVMM
jgi:hypothetical protein